MQNKNGLNFFLAIIAIITGSKLYKHVDFHPLKFEKPALDILYFITFLATLFFLLKDNFKRKEK